MEQVFTYNARLALLLASHLHNFSGGLCNSFSVGSNPNMADGPVASLIVLPRHIQ